MSFKFFLLFIFSCVLIGCSHILPEPPKEDLSKSFKLSKEQIKKYEVVEIEPVTPKEVEVKSPPKKEEIKTKKAKVKKVVKKKVAKKKLVKKKVSKPVVKKFTYPKDYPELYKQYDKESVKVWNKVSPFYRVGEKFELDIKYVGILAGHVSIESKPMVKLDGREAYHYHTKLISAKYYSMIYDLNDYIDAYVDSASLLPIKYTLIQRESKQSVDDLQIFDHKKLRTQLFYKKLKEGKERKDNKTAYTPRYFQDSFSALMFARFLPLSFGEVYSFPVVTRAKSWLLKFKIMKKESIKVAGKYYKALKINAETHYPGVLKKRGDIYFWFSDDEDRLLLKFKAKVKIGSVEGVLKKHTMPK